jgi:hypothetical protein
MDLVEVDRLDAQAPQTRFALAHDRVARKVFARSAVAFARRQQAAFGEDVGPLTDAVERARDDFLGTSEAVDGGRIDPVDPEFERSVDRADRRAIVLIAPTELPIAAADGPRAEADRRDPQIRLTEGAHFESVLHGSPRFLGSALPYDGAADTRGLSSRTRGKPEASKSAPVIHRIKSR